ncbi:NAD-dependent epimerase/dehydratase family protein [Paenibacillus daejeonensis]|uniref:NAD-dependent epimerase/dehydratase family protein n=1 Tax=Paenibacillus daejeonensis TaxID=135193 RepID=UPI000475C737|nr:NAD(P)-dependent oxidoreductase [Paenibacillus daejeonensis]
MQSVQQLEDLLSTPSEELVRDLAAIDGDIMVLGAGGKMGPSLSRLAARAVREGGLGGKRIIAVSRFSSAEARQELEEGGVETIACDLLNDEELTSLPQAANVIYMAGNKFGTTGNEHFTWAMNTYLPGRVANHFRQSRTVVFSSGNIYPFTPVGSGGADESVAPEPLGEYAQSCLGRERIFEYHGRKNETPMAMYRLNYAVDLRYGVLLEIARAVHEGRPVDVTMGHANVIWQGDANAMALRCLNLCSNPPTIVNITGPETVSIRWAAHVFGQRLGKEPQIIGTESETALLNNASRSHQLLGYPKVSLLQMIDWLSDWVQAGGATWNKPTHFQQRKGKF